MARGADLARSEYAQPRGADYGTWNPITDATFDTGIVAVDRERVGIAWFEGED